MTPRILSREGITVLSLRHSSDAKQKRASYAHLNLVQ